MVYTCIWNTTVHKRKNQKLNVREARKTCTTCHVCTSTHVLIILLLHNSLNGLTKFDTNLTDLENKKHALASMTCNSLIYTVYTYVYMYMYIQILQQACWASAFVPCVEI